MNTLPFSWIVTR